MGERMRAVLARLSVMAKAYLPGGLTEVLQDMAAEIDRLRAEVNQIKEK
jgi:hypothetical protein